jgi:hypothetical protein
MGAQKDSAHLPPEVAWLLDQAERAKQRAAEEASDGNEGHAMYYSGRRAAFRDAADWFRRRSE